MNFAQTAKCKLAPQPGQWRTSEVTTRVEMAQPQDADPCLAADSVRQQRLATTLESSFSSIAKTELTGDGQHGVRLLCVDFCANVVQPFVELPSRKTALPTGCKNKMCWKTLPPCKPTRLAPANCQSMVSCAPDGSTPTRRTASSTRSAPRKSRHDQAVPRSLRVVTFLSHNLHIVIECPEILFHSI